VQIERPDCASRVHWICSPNWTWPADLLSPEAISEAVKAFHAAAEAERRALLIERAPLQRELAEIERKLKAQQQ